MTLSAGRRIGPYAVSAKIGEGGMGEVYRARDTRLDRDVALKVLPEAFIADPDRLARFEREAKVLASLNHPNIAAIHGLEESEGTRALVLELVEGATLADRIAQGQIPVDEALPIAKQIAEALDAAHEQGIVHRDLKPANIKVRDDGTVKVLDFGLAKALQPEASGDPADSPTVTAAATASGVLLGTSAYMSPEQAKGRTVTTRTDVWAFGCVLYEMLTGRRAFPGDTVSETLVSVLSGEADLSALPSEWPSAGRRLIRRCLERDPRQRLRDVSDGLLQVEEEVVEQKDGGRPADRSDPSTSRPTLMATAVATAVLVGLVAFNLRPARTSPSRDALSVSMPDGVTLAADQQFVATLSPNGNDLVFVGRSGTTTQLYHRPLDQVSAGPVPGTERAQNPFFSPDGAWIGFKVGDLIRKVPLAGGSPVTVTQLPLAPDADRFEHGMAWSDDDMIWFGHGRRGLYAVSAIGGEWRLVLPPDGHGDDITGHFGPRELPGSQAVLNVISRESGLARGIGAYLTGSGQTRVVLDEGIRPYYAPSGHLVFSRRGSGTLQAVAFDVDALEATGDAIPVREGIRTLQNGYPQAYLGADGTLVYLPDRGNGDLRTLVWVDRTGNETPTNAVPRAYDSPRLSPDGSRVVVGVRDPATGGDDVWVHHLERGSSVRLGPGARYATWSPDGERVAFRLQGNLESLMWRAADGTGQPQQVASERDRQLYPRDWLSDGRLIVQEWDFATDGTGFDVGVVGVDGEGAEPLLRGPHAEGSPAVSPDGQWMAFHTNESGRFEIYVSPFPDTDRERHQVSIGGGLYPAWSAAGDELFYRKGISCADRDPPRPDPNDQAGALRFLGCERTAMMAVAINTEPTIVAGIPQQLFEDDYYASTGWQYDVDVDGQRFLMVRNLAAPTELVIVRNWTEELKERVPVP